MATPLRKKACRGFRILTIATFRRPTARLRSKNEEAIMNDEFEQQPFSGVEFAENPEPRCPCLLLLDVSSSMKGDPIKELNSGLMQFKDELLADSLASKRVEVSVVTFGPVEAQNDFTDVTNWTPPDLKAKGDTPMGSAIETGLGMLKARKEAYKSNGISYYRPWVFLVTDGGPTDAWAEAAKQIKQGEDAKQFSFFAVGVEGAKMETLKKISVRDPLALKELKFRELFSWLSSSLSAISASTPGDKVPLINPVAPKGWAEVA
jgi:uncharacterized protein YegL